MTLDYVPARRFAAKGKDWDNAASAWQTLATDPSAKYDRVIEIDAVSLAPFVTWGTNPGMVVPVTERVPELNGFRSDADRRAAERMFEYMALEPGTREQDISVARVLLS